MSKLLIAQIVFTVIQVFAWLVVGMQIFGLGHIDPDAMLPWVYTAAVGLGGALVCHLARVSIRFRKLEEKLEKLDKQK